MRTPIIAGNWKMNNTVSQGLSLVEELKPLAEGSRAEVVVCPPYTALHPVGEALQGTNIRLGAQNLFWQKSGAYTGQISGPMLKDVGCDYVILGHSESRGRFGVEEEGMTEDLSQVFGDTDASVNRKAHAAFEHGLTPILCCGETLAERQAEATDAIIARQVQQALQGFSADQVRQIVIAYEPVWAIGTGEVCESGEANRVCGHIRSTVESLHGSEAAQAVRIQYGGSVKPDNAAELLGQEHIDGALVGGASLKANDFAAIVNAAR
ncbi:MAG: triose-phosphate isomerase [Armatimonadetes bacterium]|nr:triose-phosphate isomerase [Armatimonadota bacterium]